MFEMLELLTNLAIILVSCVVFLFVLGVLLYIMSFLDKHNKQPRSVTKHKSNVLGTQFKNKNK